MAKPRSQSLFRIALIIGAVALLGGYVLWHSTSTSQFQEVEPGILYVAAMPSTQEGINAANKIRAGVLMVLMSQADCEGPTVDPLIQYAYHNKLGVYTPKISPGEMPPRKVIDNMLSSIRKMPAKRLPILIVSTDGRAGGALVAAYRLDVAKLPVEQVVKLSATSDTPPDVAADLQAFIRQYAGRQDATTQPNGNP